MVNLCKIGWHDYEIIYETESVKNTLRDFLKSQGFHRVEGKHVDRWTKGTGYSIKEWGFYNDWTLEGCMPFNTKSKVCLKCGRIKLTYKIERCIKELQDLIANFEKQNDREIKAREIRSKANE